MSTFHLMLLLGATALATLTATAEADLQSDLHEFQSLVPRRRIGYIAARHYIVDASFRSALAYVRSPDFSATWRQIRNTTEFTALVQLLRRRSIGNSSDSVAAADVYTGYDDITRIIDRLPQRLRSFNLPARVPIAVMFERNLSDFLSDAVQALPRQRIANLMARKVQEGGDFSHFYKALRSSKFKEQMQVARNSRSLKKPLRTLQQNYIDVDNIIKIGFDMLSWGPKLKLRE